MFHAFRTTFCFGLLGLAGLVMATGCGKKDGGSVTTPDAGKGTTGGKDGPQATAPESKEPVFKGKAGDVLKEFKDDKAAAEKKYQNKFIEIEGVVKGAPEFDDKTKLSVALADKPDNTVAVATMAPDAQAKVLELGKGQKVKVLGKVTLVLLDTMHLAECSLTEAGPNPAIKVSAKGMGKEFGTEDAAEKAAKKYENKELIVEGVVKDVKEVKGGFVPDRIVQLDAGLAEPMECQIAATLEPDFKQIKKGDKVVLKGEFKDNMLAGKHYPAIRWACLVKKD